MRRDRIFPSRSSGTKERSSIARSKPAGLRRESSLMSLRHGILQPSFVGSRLGKFHPILGNLLKTESWEDGSVERQVASWGSRSREFHVRLSKRFLFRTAPGR